MTQVAQATGISLVEVEAESPIICIESIGGGAIERAFCAKAQIAVRSAESIVQFPACPQRNEDHMCALTSYQHRCLFYDLTSDTWTTIIRSVGLEGA